MIAKSKICDLINISAQCSTYALDFTPDPAWFNGDSASIVGQCECPENMDWDDWEMTCYVSISSLVWQETSHKCWKYLYCNFCRWVFNRQEPGMSVPILDILIIVISLLAFLLSCVMLACVCVKICQFWVFVRSEASGNLPDGSDAVWNRNHFECFSY